MKSIIKVDDFTVNLDQKNIKNIYLRVNLRDGAINISAPLSLPLSEIKMFVRRKSAWIAKTQDKKVKFVADYQYCNGEKHWFAGVEYKLKLLTASKPMVWLEDKQIIMSIPKETAIIKRQQVLNGFYRAYLKATLPAKIEKYEKLIGVKISGFNVKKMKTRWGSCNVKTKFIWLNLALAKLSEDLLDYVLVHELLHLLEPKHNNNFYLLMAKYIKDWQQRSKKLNCESFSYI